MKLWSKSGGKGLKTFQELRITPNSSFSNQRSWQQRGLGNGAALQNHINAAHDGNVDPNCPACSEIQKKMEERRR